MATYSKKKRGILPSLNSFSSLRGSAASRLRKENNLKASTSTPLIVQDTTRNTSRRGDWVDEDASMLLNDTIVDHKAFSSISLHDHGPTSPQLPPMQFSNEDFSLNTHADSSSSRRRSSEATEESPHRRTKLFKTGFHSRKGSAPAIPRRSSKRKSSHPKRSHPIDINNISGPTHPIGSPTSQNIATGVQESIDRMLAHTQTLKPAAQQESGSGSNPKKRGVLAKVKNVFSDHIQARSAKKRPDPARDERLLGSSSTSVQSPEDELTEPTSITTHAEIRLNEGINLESKKKLAKLTGHTRQVNRKPIANDGRSIRSRKSFTSLRDQQGSDDIFSDGPQMNSYIRSRASTPNEDSSSMDPSGEAIPELPPMPTNAPQLRRTKPTFGYQRDLDALLTSSPVAQSTPRIRLEPNFERDGRAVLRNVPADSHSLFDPESSSVDCMDVDELPLYESQSSDQIKRKSSQLEEPEPPSAKRMRPLSPSNEGPWDQKKHPSPTRDFLRSLEDEIDNYPSWPKVRNEEASKEAHADGPAPPKHNKTESTTSVTNKRVGGILVRKDANAGLSSSYSANGFGSRPLPVLLKERDATVKPLEINKRRERGKGFAMVPTPPLTRATNTSPAIVESENKQPPPKTTKFRGAFGRNNPRSRGTTLDDSIDELQMDIMALQGKGRG